MNMVYKNRKLFIELIGEINEEKIRIMKERLFNLLDGVNIKDIEIQGKNIINTNSEISLFLDEFHNKYNSNIVINNI